jgi:cobalt/nickel transport system permease protein
MYAASAGCWWAALRRTRKKLFSRRLPLLSLFAAFSFVTMMFNLPLPGGTTGHAVGVGIAAIVLGPWASLLAISLALAIQALLFGDGGITTLGANCFNMAIAGSFAAWGIYRLVSLGATAESRRRVVAAALAGYGAINLSALLAAIEFGIQPMLFHDATGAPLYAPYPLRIAIPAMMAGHLTIAGAAEALMSAGLFSYLRRNEPELVGIAAGARASDNAALPAAGARASGNAALPAVGARASGNAALPAAGARAGNAALPAAGARASGNAALPAAGARASGNAALPAAGARASGNAALPAAGARASGNAALPAAGAGLWLVLALVLLLTPLGILASGAAWGEWAPKDFSNPAGRAQIAAASGRTALPAEAPVGLTRLANLWTAPLPDYAPHFVKSAGFGYLLSAMFGVGLILTLTWLMQRALRH